jgi:hypothetical protein
VRISQGSLVVAATTVAVIAVTLPRHSSSQVRHLPALPQAPGLHVSEPQTAQAGGSVRTLDAPIARSASSLGPRGFSVLGGSASVFSAADGQAPAPRVRASR